MNIEPTDYPSAESPPPLAYGPEPSPFPHSRLGIASVIIGALLAAVILIGFAYAGYLEATTPGGIDEESLEAGIIGLVLIGSALGLIVSLGLGVAGLFAQQRRKALPIIGTILSGLVLLGTCGLITVGVALDAGDG